MRVTIVAAALTLVCAATLQSVQAAESIEDRLRAVEDHIEIEQLLMRYAAALNTDDADDSRHGTLRG